MQQSLVLSRRDMEVDEANEGERWRNKDGND